jgi:hypothetical protein
MTKQAAGLFEAGEHCGAEANLVAPFEYTGLVWGALYGWLVWRELPSATSWLGIAIIVAAGFALVYQAQSVTLASFDSKLINLNALERREQLIPVRTRRDEAHQGVPAWAIYDGKLTSYAATARHRVIAGGATLAEGSPADVKARAGLKRIRVEADALPEVAGVDRSTRAGRVHTLYAADPGFVVRLLVEHGVPLRGLEVTPVSLEEAFLSLTERPE